MESEDVKTDILLDGSPRDKISYQDGQSVASWLQWRRIQHRTCEKAIGKTVQVAFQVSEGSRNLSSTLDDFQVHRQSRLERLLVVDNDGDMDVGVNNLSGPAMLLRNDGGNRNNWILIKTIGSKLNRNGLGAMVKVISGDMKQVDEVHSSGSYISQSDLRLHFGLGKKASIDLVEVRWPGGQIDRVENVSANRLIVVEQDRGLVK